ncbi:MAG TPA: ABC transporter permease [Candidatus Acidoferrum sp.]|nr:ABC transporter permease [Candidatus Acidoferrum sp.]
MKLRNIWIVYRKELRDSLRDRRTLIAMIVVPLLVFPLLSVGMIVLVTKVIGAAEKEVPRVMIIGGADSPKTVNDLRNVKEIKFESGTEDFKQQISDKKIRAAVEIPSGFDAALERGEPLTVTIDDYEGDIKSGFAAKKVQKFFDDLKDQTVSARLASRNLSQSFIKPFDVKTQNVAPPEKVSGAAIGGFIPYFVIILSLIGAMYPAIDLTAGEKERGTIETILCSRVSRTHIVLGKFLMVLTASLTTAVLAMISMGTSFQVAKTLMAGMAAKGEQNPLQFSIGIKAILAVFLMALPITIFFSAALLAIALMAKSYKEAQSYISPLMIVVILPAVVGMMPGTELSNQLALIPILNTTLVCKEIVSGTYHWHQIGVIFLSTCVYAAAALFIAVKQFNREEVLFRT